MADFPSTLKIGTASKKLDRDGRVVDEDGDGFGRVRKLHADRADFQLVLDRMPTADRTTLLNHYSANSLATFNFLWPPDGLTYVVKYATNPRLVEFKKTGYFTYEVKLVAG